MGQVHRVRDTKLNRLLPVEPLARHGGTSQSGRTARDPLNAISPLERNIAMSVVVAIMSMSLDGYVADLNDGVADVFDWYLTSGDVEFHTGGSDPMTFKVSGPSAEHLRGLWSGLGAVLTGRRTFDVAMAGTAITLGDQHSYLPTTSPRDGRDPTRLCNS